LEARVILFQQALDKSSTAILEEVRSKAVATYKDFLQSEWTRDAMFMNYLEGKQFATSVANIVASGRELQQDELQRILTQQASVMTARGVSCFCLFLCCAGTPKPFDTNMYVISFDEQ
jgi:hypothetical protein